MQFKLLCVLLISQRHFKQAEDHYGQHCLRKAMADWHQVRVAQLALFTKKTPDSVFLNPTMMLLFLLVSNIENLKFVNMSLLNSM